MQLLQPELKEIQRRFKGDRTKIQQAQMELYKERGVNPAAGCLPLVLPARPADPDVLGHPRRA